MAADEFYTPGWCVYMLLGVLIRYRAYFGAVLLGVDFRHPVWGCFFEVFTAIDK